MKTLLRAFALVAVAAVVGLGANAVRRDGVRLARFAEPVQCQAGEAEGAPKEIAATEVAALCGRPDVVVADARPESRFAEGHVAGAIHLPCDAAGIVAAEAMARLDGARTIVVYGERTDDARPVAESLRRRRRGSDVRVLAGGFEAWSKTGQACASGEAGAP